jgi:polysaccharide pyruvyl transferase CsaB
MLLDGEKKGGRSGVLICGAYGHDNAGDEAILDAIVLQMRMLDPSMPLTVLSRQPEKTAERYGVRALHSFDLFAILKTMKSAKLYLNGGGSLIQDATSRRSLFYYLFTLWAAKRLGCRVIMYGCGVGPVTKTGDQYLAGRIIDRNVDVITLREPGSKEELRAWGVKQPQIIIASDPAMTLPPAGEDEVDAFLLAHGIDPGGRYIGFCLRCWPGFRERPPASPRPPAWPMSAMGWCRFSCPSTSAKTGRPRIWPAKAWTSPPTGYTTRCPRSSPSEFYPA